MKKKNVLRTILVALVTICFSVPGVGLCETEMPSEFRDLKAMQMDLNRRPLDQQERLQPKVRQAELRACQKLREEQRKGVRPENYRQEGGDELLALVQQFDSYCQTLE
jgi:hypothetical protein